MSHDIDWKETDRLMEELRRQLALDEEGAVSASQSGEGDTATPVSEAAPVDVAEAAPAAPVVTRTEKESDATAVADATEERPSLFVPDEPEVEERTETAAEGAEESAAAPVAEPVTEKPTKGRKKRRPAYQVPRTTFTTRPDVLDEFADTVPVSKRRPDAVTVAPPPAADETMRAEEAVESLMRDLFGTGAAPAAPAEAPPAAPVPPAQPEAVAQPSVSAQPVASAAPVSEEAPITMTRAADGQMALALPEIDRHVSDKEEEEPIAPDKAVDGDGMQLDLFSAFTVGKERRRRGMQTEPRVATATAAERELKQSVESSEDDFRFFLDLDYEDELGRAIGFEKIRDYHELDVNGQEAPVKRRRKRGEKREYEIPRQGIALRKQYAKQKRGYVVHLVLSVVIMCLLFLYERPRLMASLFEGSPIDGAAYPVSYILIGIQLLVLAAFFSYRRLFE